MSEFNKRSWLENRFVGLYPNVMEDLSNTCIDCLESLVNEIEVLMLRGGIDLDKEGDKSSLACSVYLALNPEEDKECQ